MKVFQFKGRKGGMLRKAGCSWWYPISSGQIIYGLITFLIMSDLCYLPLPDGFGVGVEARLPRRQRNPTTSRNREDHNRYHYPHSGRHDYRNHRGHGGAGGPRRWGRRRNDNQTGDSEIIAATEVFVLDEEQVKSMMMGGSGGGGTSSGANSDMMEVGGGGGGEGANSDMAMMTMKDEQDTPGGMVGSASSPAVNVSMVQEGTAETIGIIRGFLPGLTLGGGGSKGKGGGGGGGLFGGRGLFGAGGGGARTPGAGGGENVGGGGGVTGGYEGGKVTFPEYPGANQGGGENGGGWNAGHQGKGTSTGGGGGLFGGGGGLFRNPFGGGGKGGGRSPFRLLSKLNSDQPCAAGLANLPILNKIPFLPKNRRFPSFIPSGVNTCDKTCDAGPGCSEWRRVPPTQKEKEEMGDSSCTYNWRDSLTRFPFLLFRCHCKKQKCPKKTVRLSGLLRARCENVSEKKSRCKCPYGQQSYKCVLSFLPVGIPLISRVKPYYCTCCSEGVEMGEPLGGYGGGGYGDAASTTELPVAATSISGGYDVGNAADGKTSASENVLKELAQGKPLGFESIYEHLRRRF